jgi:dTDP-4-dehydrorhamnose reductase
LKVLLTGSAGQLGQALLQQPPEGVGLIATSGGDGMMALELADAKTCRVAVQELRPDWVLNGGGYTAVDKAESEPEQTLAVNGGAPRAFAEALLEAGGRLLQVSRDFVFNGQQGSPYRPYESRDPLGAYGRTKAAGEEAVEQVLCCSGSGVILRTRWVMGPVGKNFALTMLRLHRERGANGQAFGIVEDHVGFPTSTHTLAAACWQTITAGISESVLHWSDAGAGAANWFDVAVAVGEQALALGLVEQIAPVDPLDTAEFPTLTERLSNSLLDCSASRRTLQLVPKPWRQVLRQLLKAAA